MHNLLDSLIQKTMNRDKTLSYIHEMFALPRDRVSWLPTALAFFQLTLKEEVTAVELGELEVQP